MEHVTDITYQWSQSVTLESFLVVYLLLLRGVAVQQYDSHAVLQTLCDQTAPDARLPVWYCNG